jgi:hypothetical protein
MPAVNTLLTWTLVAECPIPDDVAPLFVDRETAVAPYKIWSLENAGSFIDINAELESWAGNDPYQG